MPRYVWTGPYTNLSRFGFVREGDQLVLTPKEEAYILENEHPHLVPFDPAKHALPKKQQPFKPHPNDLPPGFDQMPKENQQKIVAALEQKELARKAEIAKANEQSGKMVYSEMTKQELLDEIERLRADGKKIEFQKDASKSALIAAIRQGLGQDNRGDAGGGAGEGDDQ